MKKIIVIPKPKKLEIGALPPDLSDYLVQRKANGVGCTGRTQNGLFFHSRGVSEVTGDHIPYSTKLPLIQSELESRNIPEDSLWYMELVVDKSQRISYKHPSSVEVYREDFNKVNGIIQWGGQHIDHASVVAIMLEIFRWDGQDVTKKSNEWRYSLIKECLKVDHPQQRVIWPTNYVPASDIDLLQNLTRGLWYSWEGVVLKKKEGTIFYREYDKTASTSTPRYDSQFKIVLPQHTEVIITGYRLSKKDPTRIGSFEMCWNKGGKLIYVGHCAGLNEVWKSIPKTKPQLPFVANVKYKEITPDGKLLNAVFAGKNLYKTVWDCVHEEDKK